MSIECYYDSCPYHGTQEIPPDEGPFCPEAECRATPDELSLYGTLRKLERMGYTREDLDASNPYTQHERDL